MTEERTPRQIVLDMEPVLRNVRDGVNAAVGLGSSDRYDTGEPNGLAYIADSLERHVNQLHELWLELYRVSKTAKLIEGQKACGPPVVADSKPPIGEVRS